jgi:hypothetical protein
MSQLVRPHTLHFKQSVSIQRIIYSVYAGFSSNHTACADCIWMADRQESYALLDCKAKLGKLSQSASNGRYVNDVG